ncbi:VanZ family protein [candidate division WOR-3 bacterium]|nr:VanZ family protein [candidate division WOR-3 bacterium]
MGNGKVLRSIDVTEKLLAYVPRGTGNVAQDNTSTNRQSALHEFPAKRIFDILLAGFGLIFSSPLWALIALAIIIEDGFPVFIRQNRIGKAGRLFKNYKFRSMKKHTLLEKVNMQAQEHDLRITMVGKILRRCAMDELPQLLNILFGDMSFVGPRALLPNEAEVHTHTNGGTLNIAEIPGFARRITVIPGLTGIAQIYAPRDIPRKYKFKYDLLYMRKRSFWFDIKLILISFLVTLRSSWEKRGTKLNLLKTRHFVPENIPSAEAARSLEKRFAEDLRKWRKGETGIRRFPDFIITWAPLAIFLILIFPFFNLYDRTLYTWDHFKIFGDTIRVFAPETPLYVLTTLWGVVRDFSHVFAYAFVTFLLFRGFTQKGKVVKINHFVYTSSLLFVLCMLDETIQAFMPSRGFEVTDIMLNLLSAALVLLIMYHRYHSKIVAAESIRYSSKVASIIRAWLPPVVYVGILMIIANFVMTNDNTLYAINQFAAAFKPQVNHGTLCMWVGKTRDYSHIIIYAMLTLLVFRALRKTWTWSFVRYVIFAMIIGLNLGMGDELIQSLIIGRSASLTDWIIDVQGVGLGIVYLVIHNLRRIKFKAKR